MLNHLIFTTISFTDEQTRVLYNIYFKDGEAGTERLYSYLVAELASKPRSEAWEPELLVLALDNLSIYFYILQNLYFTEFGIHIVLFTYRSYNNYIYALMKTLWSEYDVFNIEYTCLETKPSEKLF